MANKAKLANPGRDFITERLVDCLILLRNCFDSGGPAPPVLSARKPNPCLVGYVGLLSLIATPVQTLAFEEPNRVESEGALLVFKRGSRPRSGVASIEKLLAQPAQEAT